MPIKISATILALAVAVTPAWSANPQPSVGAEQVQLPVITAPIALMVDVNSGRVLFERQSHRRFVPASLTKIMTSYVAFDLIRQGKLSLDRKIRMRPETFRAWHRVGSTMFLADGSETSVADLLEGIVTVSANDACVVLAEGIAGSVPAFTAMMNTEARKLGMRDTYYNTPNGWMDEGRTYVSAADLATLSTALITEHPDLYRRFYGHERMAWNGIEQANHNPLYGHTEGADGVKTGFTNEAGYGLVGSAVRNGRRLMMVLGGYDHASDRATQSREFIEWGFAAWQAKPLFAEGARVGSAKVRGGSSRQVDLIAPRDLAITLPKGVSSPYTLSIRYHGPISAPIAKGQQIATLIVRVPGQADAQLPLAASQDVPDGGAIARFRDGLLAMIGK